MGRFEQLTKPYITVQRKFCFRVDCWNAELRNKPVSLPCGWKSISWKKLVQSVGPPSICWSAQSVCQLLVQSINIVISFNQLRMLFSVDEESLVEIQEINKNAFDNQSILSVISCSRYITRSGQEMNKIRLTINQSIQSVISSNQ